MKTPRPTANLAPAEIFPPGEFIRDELDARGWEQRDLADIMGRPERTISELVSGKRSVTPETAQQLGEAFATSAQFWLNLEMAYRLWKLPKPDDAVARRARLYALAPIKEMTRRGWVGKTKRVDTLEEQVSRFFEVPSLDAVDAQMSASSPIGAAARKSSGDANFTPAERAWLCRARQLASQRFVSTHHASTYHGAAHEITPFDPARIKALLPRLSALLDRAEGVREAPKALAAFGVRLVVVEPIAGTKIDGACFWLSAKKPVIALSLRFDRIDCFWFTLMHEIAHVVAGDGRDGAIPPDRELVGNDGAATPSKPAFEKAADRFAATSLVPEKPLADFIKRTRPYFSKARIEEFAAAQGVHPGLVVGQLHHRGEVPYSNLRGYLVKVRALVLEAALADGWGITPRP